MKKNIVFQLDTTSPKNMDGAYLSYEAKGDTLLISADREGLEQISQKLAKLAELQKGETEFSYTEDSAADRAYRKEKTAEGNAFLEKVKALAPDTSDLMVFSADNKMYSLVVTRMPRGSGYHVNLLEGPRKYYLVNTDGKYMYHEKQPRPKLALMSFEDVKAAVEYFVVNRGAIVPRGEEE